MGQKIGETGIGWIRRQGKSIGDIGTRSRRYRYKKKMDY